MPDPIVITIPGQIDPILTPNGRGNPLKRQRISNALKSDAMFATMEALDLPRSPVPELTPPITLHYLIAHGKGRKRLDDDNAIGAMKAVRDGIAIALHVDDRHMQTGTMTQDRDTTGAGYIRVAIESGENP